MNTHRNLLLVLMLTLGLALLPACSKDDPLAPSTDSFAAVIDGGGTYKSATPTEDVEVVDTAEDELPDGSIVVCTTERHSIVDTPLNYATFDPTADVLFPGNLLQGSSLGGLLPTPIAVERASGTISINLLNGSDEVSATVDHVRYSEVIQAMNDIIARNTGVLPAAFTYQMSQVQSREEMALKMGVNVASLTTDVRAKLSLSSQTSYNSFLVQLNQRYYTMAFDLPTSAAALFADSVAPADVARYVGNANPATYISSVTYGRRFYLLIESTETASEMRGSIRASYNAALAGGSGYLEGRDFSSLSNVEVKVFALGGDQQLALAAFNGDVDAVASFLTQGGSIDTGVPLSYAVRNVKDNSAVAVNVATDYEVRNCIVQTVGTLAFDFNETTEGWTGYADYRDFGVYTEGAIDGGYIKLFDRGQGQTCYFRAPLAVTGDWSQFFDGRMSFYLWIGGPGDYGALDDVVILDTAGNRLALRFGGSPPSTGFLPYYIDMNATENWVFNGQPATDANIQTVLSSVSDLFIRAEYRNKAGDWGAMDRFRLVTPANKYLLEEDKIQ